MLSPLVLPCSSDVKGNTAMEAGVTDHVWDIEEILELL
jgi:hypothetical protein